MSGKQTSRGIFWFAVVSFWALSIILLFAVLKVAPIFLEIYNEFGAPLPTVTLAVLRLSALFRDLYMVAVPLALGVMAGGYFLMVRLEGKVPLILFPLSVSISIALLVLAMFLPILRLSASLD